MARIGIQTWGSRGDVEPFLALARGLADAGHAVEVSMATASDVHYAASEGVTLTRADGEVTQAEMATMVREVSQIASPLEQGRAMMRRGFDPYYDELMSAAKTLAGRCDVVVRHHFLSMAQAAARAEGVPEVSVFLTPDLLPTREHPPTGMPSFGPLQGLAWWMMAKGAGGVFNLTAPHPIISRSFYQTLAKVMHRPCWLQVPGWALKMLMGQMAEELILSGQRVLPKRLSEAGYRFVYPDLTGALEEIAGPKAKPLPRLKAPPDSGRKNRYVQ